MSIARGRVAATVFSAAMISGAAWLHLGARGSTGHGVNGQALFQSVWTHVARNYVDSVPDSALYHKAAVGLVNALGDPHSAFLGPDRLRKLSERTSGTIGATGIDVDADGGTIVVVAAPPGTVAERAGIQSGDRLIEIAGAPTVGWTADEAMRALRGQPGTSVSLIVERTGVGLRLPFTLTRRETHRRAVQRATLLRPTVGYVRLDIFSDSTARELRGAVDSLVAAGARSMVLDLRDNPGGLLEEGVQVSDLFLDPPQRIVSTRGRTPSATHDFVDSTKQRWPTLPLAVLIDGSSASAAEIVAGALQDHDRALLIGSPSYGKGSAQTVFPISGFGALKLTTARWFTPAGRSINREPSADDGETSFDTTPPKYTTDGGRVVIGGGGITPDIAAGDTIVPPEQLALQRALGPRLGVFRDLLEEEAHRLRRDPSVRFPNFVVTPAMRESLWQHMRQRKLNVPRHVFDSASTVVSRLLGYRIAREAFGPTAEFARLAADDDVLRAAVQLADGVHDRDELMRRGAAVAARVPARTR